MRDFARLQIDRLNGGHAGALGLALVFALGLSLLGALEIGRQAPFSRLGYWTVNLVAWSKGATFVVETLRSWPTAQALTRGQSLVLATLISSVPMLAVTVSTTMALCDWQPSPGDVAEQLGAIWLIGGTFLLVWDWHRTPPPDRSPVPSVAEVPATAIAQGLGARLQDRLPAALGKNVVCLRVEDHYVRVYTALGSALILSRFSDALADVAAVTGLRVHRSWWVACAAVDDIRRTGRTAQLLLSNGLTVPVSQPYMTDASSAFGPVPKP